MKKIHIAPRPHKAEKLASIGFSFHELDNYWKESLCYEFNSEQIATLEKATNELHQMCLEAVKYAINHNRLFQMAIPELYHEKIKSSLNEPSFYGRFDLWYDGVSKPKMLEYNADTPTSVLEGGIAQANWQQDVFPQYRQFNRLHETMKSRWQELDYKNVTFACLKDNEEDLVCLSYIMQTAVEAGVNCDLVYIEDIAYKNKQFFVDKPISHLFKLYPYEWLMMEEFGPYIVDSHTQFIEPMWKSILSNKAILPLLYEMFPTSDYILPAYFNDNGMAEYCKKPFFSREGANIEISAANSIKNTGPYGREGYIYQQYQELPLFEGFYPVIGSWIVGDRACGIAVREDTKVITTNMSHFIPHYVVTK